MKAYSYKQFKELGFDGKEYEFNEQEGTFTGTLACKRWGMKNNIIAYVDFDDGRKIKCASFDRENNFIGIPDIEIGSRISLIFAENRMHNVRLKLVEVIEDNREKQ